MDCLHAKGVLRSQRGNHAHSVDMVGGKGLEIGLDSGAATAVRAGN